MGTSQFLCFLPLTLMIIQSAITISAAPNYMSEICQEGNFTSGSKFQANLNLLLSSLSSDVLTVNNGFSNRTSGRNPDKVRGLFLCRGDLTNDVCQSCVTTAAEDIKKKCPNKKEAIIFYDECMLRYSNQSIFSMVQKNPGAAFFNMNNASDPDRFKPLLGELLEELVTRATVNSSRFSTGTKDLNSTQKIYGLAQCTPDLSSKGCKECLVDATSEIPSCCDGKQGGRVLLPSCNVRYETYAFYKSEADNSPAPSPTALSPPTTAPSPDSIAPPPQNPTEADHSPAPSPDSIAPPPQNPTEDNRSPDPSPALLPDPHSTPPFSESLAPPPRKEKNIFNNLLTLIMPLVVTLVLATGNQCPH
ncbi:hypothetical protein MKW92_012994 [Papaver armeniacum]|nr:hypothetical protein MKW92_012994 [Papaver armeniacum]